MKKLVFLIAAGSLLAGGCSTRPRQFQPVLTVTPADSRSYENDLAECQSLVASGKHSGFGPAIAATGAGVAAGYGAGAATIATGAVPLGIGMSAGAAVAALSIMPLAGLAAGVGVTRAIRSGKEKKINRAMTECLAAHGHSVSSWEPAKKPRKASPAPSPQD